MIMKAGTSQSQELQGELANWRPRRASSLIPKAWEPTEPKIQFQSKIWQEKPMLQFVWRQEKVDIPGQRQSGRSSLLCGRVTLEENLLYPSYLKYSFWKCKQIRDET